MLRLPICEQLRRELLFNFSSSCASLRSVARCCEYRSEAVEFVEDLVSTMTKSDCHGQVVRLAMAYVDLFHAARAKRELCVQTCHASFWDHLVETDPDGAAGIEVTVVSCCFLAIKFLGAGTTLKMRYSCIDDQCGVRFGDFGDYVPCFDSMASFCVLRRLYEELDHDPAPIPTHDELFHREAQICEALEWRLRVLLADDCDLPHLIGLACRESERGWAPNPAGIAEHSQAFLDLVSTKNLCYFEAKPIVVAAACVLSALWVQRQDFAVAAARLGALVCAELARGLGGDALAAAEQQLVQVTRWLVDGWKELPPHDAAANPLAKRYRYSVRDGRVMSGRSLHVARSSPLPLRPAGSASFVPSSCAAIGAIAPPSDFALRVPMMEEWLVGSAAEDDETMSQSTCTDVEDREDVPSTAEQGMRARMVGPSPICQNARGGGKAAAEDREEEDETGDVDDLNFEVRCFYAARKRRHDDDEDDQKGVGKEEEEEEEIGEEEEEGHEGAG